MTILKEIFNHQVTDEALHDAVGSILQRIHHEGPISPADLEVLAHIKISNPNLLGAYNSELATLMGLFYKERPEGGLFETVYDIFKDSIKDSTGLSLTPVQASIYQQISNKRYFSFSAPTSSGKSHLFRELVKGTSGDIVVIVPSRALIAEYMKEVKEIVGDDKSVLVMEFAENVNRAHTGRRVYILTPERTEYLFKIARDINIELFLFDEAQISEEPVRGVRFDSLVRRLDKELPEVKKVFTHPFITNPEAQLKKHNFRVKASAYAYPQHTTGKAFISVLNNRFKYFSPYTGEDAKSCEVNPIIEAFTEGSRLLVYISKKKIYDGLHIVEFSEYIQECPDIEDTKGLDIIKQLSDYIGASDGRVADKYSKMIQLMKKGVVIHHGSIPLKARLLIEEFVNDGFARICFATSTLLQGINMPFDMVWIDNFRFDGASEDEKILGLRNLIGRAGRNSLGPEYDYGLVIVKSNNRKTLSERLAEGAIEISETSKLNVPLDQVAEDERDVVEAVQNDTFDVELNLTKAQLERIKKSKSFEHIEYLLDNLLVGSRIVTNEEYQELGSKEKIKDAFKYIYSSHLRKENLSEREKRILSVAVSIMLMKVQGWSFRRIVGLRKSYMLQEDKQKKLKTALKAEELTAEEFAEQFDALRIKFSQEADKLPNRGSGRNVLFPSPNDKIHNFDYDRLVYDTYDYLDKVIALSLTDPICGALKLYSDENSDPRAETLRNYIKFGTNDETEIWLLRYGFDPEDIEWIISYVSSINADEIRFKENISDLPEEKMSVISRYVN